ncbi:hypothetical protein JDN40_00350 [Rhodomicrobium vannielii ATCC 17100]|uniref:hypothetical protein n=1 Tax=Rhodomicrobium vannielii TaxID=1069 RepID=UPI00191A9054|nr:hypothetical protein [Rhodomicrobium vannielii]MBJ7532592.1 hypothetical protein [Rhodomicrobium vannielii ATCC 17100]
MSNDINEKLHLLRSRRDAQKKWIADEAPYMVADQRHLDANTPERAYWHYGYASALTDVLDLLEGRPSNQKPGNTGSSTRSRSGDQDE